MEFVYKKFSRSKKMFYSTVIRNNTGCLIAALKRAPFQPKDSRFMALEELHDMPAFDTLRPKITPAYRVQASEVFYLGLQIACSFISNRSCFGDQ
jgi:hypothetical protein